MGGVEYALTAEEANLNTEAMILSCLRLGMVDMVCLRAITVFFLASLSE